MNNGCGRTMVVGDMHILATSQPMPATIHAPQPGVTPAERVASSPILIVIRHFPDLRQIKEAT